MSNSAIFLSSVTVETDPAGALGGDGSIGDPLEVLVDGVTITVNGSNQLVAEGGEGITGTLTAGQVPYATGANTVASDDGLAYDSALKRLSVGGSFSLLNPDTTSVLVARHITSPAIRNQTTLQAAMGQGNNPGDEVLQVLDERGNTLFLVNQDTTGIGSTVYQQATQGGPDNDYAGLLVQLDSHPSGSGFQEALLALQIYPGDTLRNALKVDAFNDLNTPANSYVQATFSADPNQVEGTPVLLVKDTSGTIAFTVSPAGAVTASDFIIGNGKAFKTDTTDAHTGLIQAYDVDGAAYKTFGTLTNGNTPSLALAAPSGGTLTGNFTTLKLGGVDLVLTGTTGSIGGGLLVGVGSTATGTVTVTGAVVGQPVAVSASDGTLPNALISLSAAVTSSNTVTVQLTALAAVTPTAKTYNVAVLP